MSNWREHNGDTSSEQSLQCDELKPICWHCCKTIEDDEQYEIVCGDMFYHVECLID